jgi:metal-sulfur cluster biosynthetic enzyme
VQLYFYELDAMDFTKKVTREDVIKAIEHVEHPEIALTLLELGMILDVVVENRMTRVALSLPILGIPEAVRNIIVESIRKPIENLGLKMEIEFFEMTREARDHFFTLSRANWKGQI